MTDSLFPLVERWTGFCACCKTAWAGYPTSQPCTTPLSSYSHPSPSPKAQPVRGSSYRGHAHFSIMSSSACRKRKPLVQPETLEHSTRDSSLSSALHFLNEIPLPLSLKAAGGRERGKGWSEAAVEEKKILFFLFFAKCSSWKEEFWYWEGVWEEI